MKSFINIYPNHPPGYTFLHFQKGFLPIKQIAKSVFHFEVRIPRRLCENKNYTGNGKGKGRGTGKGTGTENGGFRNEKMESVND